MLTILSVVTYAALVAVAVPGVWIATTPKVAGASALLAFCLGVVAFLVLRSPWTWIGVVAVFAALVGVFRAFRFSRDAPLNRVQ